MIERTAWSERPGLRFDSSSQGNRRRRPGGAFEPLGGENPRPPLDLTFCRGLTGFDGHTEEASFTVAAEEENGEILLDGQESGCCNGLLRVRNLTRS